MKKILIALDYDSLAKKITDVGVKMANAMDANITLLHVISPSMQNLSLQYSSVFDFTGYVDMNPLDIVTVDEFKNAALKYLDKIKLHYKDSKINTMVVEGEVADVILETANKIHADIIVLGSHSSKWLEDILIGSVAENVLHKTAVPLFIIPTKQL